jgi:predicted kinase
LTNLFITVGIPGCGKSTYAQLVQSMGRIDVIVSTDKIREGLSGDAADQTYNDAVFHVAHNRVRSALIADLNVVFDATNLRCKDRRVLLDIAHERKATPVALYFSISSDFDTCQRRNLARERNVPEDVMRRFHERFVLDCSPSVLENEGWEVTHIQ